MTQRDNLTLLCVRGHDPNTTLHTVVLISLYLVPQARDHNGVAGVGAIAGLAGGVFIVLMPWATFHPGR